MCGWKVTRERLQCRGNGASVLRIVPYAALHFTAYERYRRGLLDAVGVDPEDPTKQAPLPSSSGSTLIHSGEHCSAARTVPNAYAQGFLSWTSTFGL